MRGRALALPRARKKFTRTHAHAHTQDDLLDWSSSATCSPLPSLGPSTGVCSGTCSGGCSPSPPQRQAASPGAAGAPTSSGGSTQYATASSSSGSRFGGDQGCAGSPGAGQADPPGSPPVADASPGSRKVRCLHLASARPRACAPATSSSPLHLPLAARGAARAARPPGERVHPDGAHARPGTPGALRPNRGRRRAAA